MTSNPSRILVALCTLICLPLVAQSDPGVATDPELEASLSEAIDTEARMPVGSWQLDLQALSEVRLPSDMDRGGDLTTIAYGLELRGNGPGWTGALLRFDVGYEVRQYDFDGGNRGFAGGRELLDEAQSLRASFDVIQAVSREWGILLGGGIEANAAFGADLADGINYRLLAGVGYRASEELTLGIAVLVLGRLEEDPLIIPGPFVDWRATDELRLRLAGPRIELEWSVQEQLSVGFEAGFDNHRIRLDEGEPGRGGVFEDQRVSIGVSVGYQVAEKARLDFELGVDVYRELAWSDASGNRIDEEELDPGLFFGFGLTLRF